jgi:hypothetical protein
LETHRQHGDLKDLLSRKEIEARNILIYLFHVSGKGAVPVLNKSQIIETYEGEKVQLLVPTLYILDTESVVK